MESAQAQGTEVNVPFADRACALARWPTGRSLPVAWVPGNAVRCDGSRRLIA